MPAGMGNRCAHGSPDCQVGSAVNDCEIAGIVDGGIGGQLLGMLTGGAAAAGGGMDIG